jgi:hypothetical protein
MVVGVLTPKTPKTCNSSVATVTGLYSYSHLHWNKSKPKKRVAAQSAATRFRVLCPNKIDYSYIKY